MAIFTQQTKDSLERPDASLRDVQGVYSWNLGDTLRDGFELKTNDGLGESGIKYDMPLESLSSEQPCVMWLVLTEERRIASIYVSIPRDAQKEAVYDALRQKYGFRKIFHNSAQGDYTAYFGTTKRQAVFSQMTTIFGSMSVEYRDEQLCKIAEEQQEKRREALDKHKAEEIKSRL